MSTPASAPVDTDGPPVVGVIGLGLIGGSLAQAWSPNPVVGWSPSEGTRAKAAAGGVEVLATVEQVVERSDLVVLAVPLPVLLDTVEQVASAVAARPGPPPTVTDVGSVKGPVARRAAEVFADPGIFVPGHPIAGTEHAGWDHADPDLFRGATWALVADEPVDLRHWKLVARVALVTGAHVLPVSASEHDQAVAVTSHLPHLLAALLTDALGRAPGCAPALTGGSFHGATRVVSGSGRSLGPQMAAANPELAEVASQFAARLQTVANALADPDPAVAEAALRTAFGAGSLESLLSVDARRVPLPFDRATLLALGAAGVRVLGFDGTHDRMLVEQPLAAVDGTS